MAKTADYTFKSNTMLHRDMIESDKDEMIAGGETRSLPTHYGDSLADMGLCERAEPAAPEKKKTGKGGKHDAPDAALVKIAQEDVALAEDALSKAPDDQKAAAQTALDEAKVALAGLAA